VLFQREAGRLLIALAIAFALMLLAAAYWAVTGSEGILLRTDNPRIFAAEAAVRRGAIFDRGERLIAQSIPTSERVGAAMRRVYPNDAFFGAIGYFSQRYGVNGIEAAYDTLLHGRQNADRDAGDLLQSLLRRPRVGDDIMTTLDSTVQAALSEGFAGLKGGAVVLDAHTGAVLGLLSRPTYNPNTLDADWEALVDAPDNPFFNRAVQGRYQPGGALQVVFMASALLSGFNPDTPFEEGARPLELNGLNIVCARTPAAMPERTLTLRQAFSSGCPRPFAVLADRLPAGVINASIASFQLNAPLSFPGYPPLPIPDETGLPDDTAVGQTAFLTGQGALLVSPLTMARIAAGIANDGDAPQPRLLHATRPAETETWLIDTTFIPTTPMTTQTAARGIQRLMRETVASGLIEDAQIAALNMGGHVSFAYTGSETLTWFLGFGGNGSGRVAVALVLEGEADPQRAAAIGARALIAAFADAP
jgi:peptidoglycan glycosyltransferase